MNTQPVLCKVWIPVRFTCTDKQVPGTGRMSDEYLMPGKFHQWGLESVETNESTTNYSVGIVEMPDGTVQTITPNNIKFVDLKTYFEAREKLLDTELSRIQL